jgi:hypothetical protein
MMGPLKRNVVPLQQISAYYKKIKNSNEVNSHQGMDPFPLP